ncbi:MAG: hypothetical protein JSR21_12635 [Proteobacteria bacterium]|nr:hypothetical protein [Pseudomonadota bacterium]
MSSVSDGRIPVRFGAAADAAPDEALLIERPDAAPPGAARAAAAFVLPVGFHPAGCACCPPRGPAAAALARLFVARARGEAPMFAAVVAVTRTEAGAAAVRQALADDLLAKARFRLE